MALEHTSVNGAQGAPVGVNGEPRAPITNVRLFRELMERLMNRPRHLSGFGVFHGPAGYGKTIAGCHTADRTRSVYVEAGYSWNASTLTDNIYHVITGTFMTGSVAKKVEAIIAILAADGRPLIIDEADHLVKKSTIEIVREIADRTAIPLLLIGMEHLPHNLRAFQYVHTRVMDFQAAQPCTIEDAQLMRKLYHPKLEVDDVLMAHILRTSDFTPRRICVNLQRVQEFAHRQGLSKVTMIDWGEQVLFTGNPALRVTKQRVGA